MLRTVLSSLTLSLVCMSCADATDSPREGGLLEVDDSAVVLRDAGERDADETADAESGRDAEPGAAPDAAPLDAGAQSDAGDAQVKGCPLPDVAPTCEASLCKVATGEVWLAVHGDQPWYIGANDWMGAICERAIGWPRSRSSDGLTLGYRVKAEDLVELRAGSALQVAYGSGEVDPRTAQRCAFDARAPLVDCPFEGTCTQNAMDLQARLPARPECVASCDGDYGLDPCFGVGGWECHCWCFNRDLLLELCPPLTP